MKYWLVIGAVTLVGCSQSKPTTQPSTAISPAPTVVAAAFLQAVADSNLHQMAELWGTARGSAASTGQPPNWLQRVAVIQAYLRGGTGRVLGESPGGSTADHRQLIIELNRSGCVKSIPFTMVKTKDGAWLVNAIDLNAAGVPGRPCDTKKPGT